MTIEERKPYHPHDCDKCTYVGTVHIGDDEDDGFFDIYRCLAHGTGMTILRGDADDEPLAIPDTGVAALLEAAVQSAAQGEEEAGVLLMACGATVANGVMPIGGA